MQPYDFNGLGPDIQNWMMSRFLEPILYIEGGWEYWIQIDFPAWLDNYHATQFDFRREVTGVLANARLDWLANSQGDEGQQTAVEIKAQTHKYQTAPFIRDVLADVRKLSGLNQNYEKIMLAAVIDRDTVTALMRRGQGPSFHSIAHIGGVNFLSKSWK